MVRRLGRLAGLLALVVILNFLAPRALPGSPAFGGAGVDAAVLPAAAREALIRTYHLDAPLWEQFLRYVSGLLRGDLGYSVISHRPVSHTIGERLPWTLFLTGGSVLVAAAVGGWVGWVSAWHTTRFSTRAALTATVGLGALPEFLVAMIAIALLVSRFHIFPPGGAFSPFARAAGLTPFLSDIAWHAALPGATLVIALAPAFALLVRNAVIPLRGERFLLTAQAKGLPPRRIAWHVLRNAIPPIATLFGLRLAAAVAGAAVVERIFAYPGIGWLLYESVSTRDYPVLQGVVFASSVAVLAVTFVLDALAARLDPRTTDL